MPAQEESLCLASQAQPIARTVDAASAEWSAAKLFDKALTPWAADTATIVSKPHGCFSGDPDDPSGIG